MRQTTHRSIEAALGHGRRADLERNNVTKRPFAARAASEAGRETTKRMPIRRDLRLLLSGRLMGIEPRLRVRAAEHGRSAEAEHREILRMALTGAPATRRQEAADRLARSDVELLVPGFWLNEACNVGSFMDYGLSIASDLPLHPALRSRVTGLRSSRYPLDWPSPSSAPRLSPQGSGRSGGKLGFT